VGCYIWYSEEGPGRAVAPPSHLLVVPNVTATHQWPVYQSLYDGALLCSFNVAIKGLSDINRDLHTCVKVDSTPGLLITELTIDYKTTVWTSKKVHMILY